MAPGTLRVVIYRSSNCTSISSPSASRKAAMMDMSCRQQHTTFINTQYKDTV